MDRKVIFSDLRKTYWVGLHQETNTYPISSKRYGKDGKLLFRTAQEYNDDEEMYVKHFADPMASVTCHTRTFYIERVGDKLSIKMYEKFKTRTRGTSYFKEKKHMWFFTVNLVTGDFYQGKLLNYQNKIKRTKHIRRNCFYDSIVSFLPGIISDFFYSYIKDKDERNEYIDYLLNIFKYEMLAHMENKTLSTYSLIRLLYVFYLTKKGVKYPNNVDVFTSGHGKLDFLPTMKEFKKTKMKYMDAFMLRNNLKGDKVKKILHTISFINLGWYKIAINLFGTEWIHQDDELLTELLNNQNQINSSDTNVTISNWSIGEKKRCFEMFKKFTWSKTSFSTFVDHIKLLNYLKEVGEDVKWESKNLVDFSQEHQFLSELKQSYVIGKFTRIYSDGFLNEFKSFEINGEKYHPKVLLTTDDFNEESSHQHNCVRGYVDKTSSFVLSLRKGDERATVEYEVSISQGKFHMKRVQYLAKHNKNLDESWNEALNFVDGMVNKNLRKFVFIMGLKKETKSKTYEYKLKPNENNLGFKWVDDNGFEMNRNPSSFFDFLI